MGTRGNLRKVSCGSQMLTLPPCRVKADSHCSFGGGKAACWVYVVKRLSIHKTRSQFVRQTLQAQAVFTHAAARRPWTVSLRTLGL